YWSESFGNPHSTDHAIGWRAAKAVQEAAESVAGLIGADPDEIVFTSGATEANNLALFGLARRAAPGRNRILVSAIEHKCVLAASRALAAREGFIVETIPVDHEGFIDLAALEARLGEDVLVVSVMAVNNEIGTIQDVPRLAAVLTPFGVPLHCDAAQAPCGMAVGSLANHADLLSLSGHKVYGPQGIGALYVRRPLQRGLEPLVHGGGQQNGLRSGTVPLALCVGLAAAVDLLRGTETMAEMKRIGEQRDRFVRLLSSGDCSILVNGPSGNRRHPANANLGFEGVDAHDLLNVLQPRLAASTGAACTSGVPEASHVLSALGVTRSESDASIRFSFGRYTSDDEIERAASLVLQGVELLLSERPTRARAGELAI
ncbi:MAG: cysteine desulfurase, partial [Acidobacteria bacterium]|nr:cysteine desulfurase [Acidobacteriota bacterium]